MQKTVGIFEAKTHLSSLIDIIKAYNQEVIITRRGEKVAKLVGIQEEDERRESVRKAIQEMREFRKGNRLGGLSIKNLVEEGRR
jgi:prevent-host-death family protein